MRFKIQLDVEIDVDKWADQYGNGLRDRAVSQILAELHSREWYFQEGPGEVVIHDVRAAAAPPRMDGSEFCPLCERRARVIARSGNEQRLSCGHIRVLPAHGEPKPENWMAPADGEPM